MAADSVYNTDKSYIQKIYGCASEILFSAAKPFLTGKYDEGNDQRFGYGLAELPKNALWIHAVSVGEVQSAYPFVKEIKTQAPEMPILLSTITKTGRAMSTQLMGETVDRIYYPWDSPSIINRALDTLTPRAYVTIETEIWPEMLFQLQRRRIPSFLVNGRLSEASFKKYRPFRSFWGPVIGRYTLVFVRSDIERQRFIDLGVSPEKIKVAGDCKVDALIQRKNTLDSSSLAPYFRGQAPVILAGSTHQGEDSIVLQAYAALLKKFPTLRLVLVPRHPERAKTLAQQAKNLRFAGVALMTEKNYAWKLMIVDQIGQLLPLYSRAKAAFIGGSLVPKGGQNIIEPAIWGTPFCQGPYFSDFDQATKDLQKIGACRIVRNAGEMAQFFEEKILSPDQTPLHQACTNYIATHSGASARTWDHIKKILDQNQKN